MKFTKPISREVEINGNPFVLTFDETGVEFRGKGKRKSSRVEWTQVLVLVEGEPSTTPRQASEQDEDQSRQPESLGGSERSAASGATGPDDDSGEELSRRTSAGEGGL